MSCITAYQRLQRTCGQTNDAPPPLVARCYEQRRKEHRLVIRVGDDEQGDWGPGQRSGRFKTAVSRPDVAHRPDVDQVAASGYE